jgi:hypothetical protein
LWPNSMTEIIDVYFQAEQTPGGTWQFQNPRTTGLVAASVELIQLRITAHDVIGDRAKWLSQDLLQSLTDALASPSFVASADLLTALNQAPAANNALAFVLADMFDQTNLLSAPTRYDQTVTAAADILQTFVDDQQVIPILHVIGKAIDPSRPWLTATLKLVEASAQPDNGDSLSRLLRHLLVPKAVQDIGRSPLSDLSDAVTQIHRSNAGTERGQAMTAQDYRAVWKGIDAFITEQKRGIEKFVGIIQTRDP